MLLSPKLIPCANILDNEAPSDSDLDPLSNITWRLNISMSVTIVQPPMHATGVLHNIIRIRSDIVWLKFFILRVSWLQSGWWGPAGITHCVISSFLVHFDENTHSSATSHTFSTHFLDLHNIGTPLPLQPKHPTHYCPNTITILILSPPFLLSIFHYAFLPCVNC